LRRSFSNSLERVGKRLIGLHEEGQSGGFFGFGMRIMIEYFHNIVKYDKRSIKCVLGKLWFFWEGV